MKAHIWLSIWLLWTPSLYLVPFSRYLTSKFLRFDLDLWPLKVIWGQKIVYSSKAHQWLPIWLLRTPSLYLVPFSRYSTSKFFRVWPWPLTSKGHLGSNISILFESPYMTSYLTSMDTISLSRIVFEIFDFKWFSGFDLDLWPLAVIWGQIILYHSKAHQWLPIWLLWTPSLYLGTVFEIFDFKVFRVWPWPLTSKDHLGSNISILFESPYMTSYLTSMDTISLSRIVFEIFDFKIFRVWPWPLTSSGHLGSNYFIPFESPYMSSSLTSMDTISLSRTTLEIMPVKILKAEQNGGFWPFKGQGQE